jgi:hypothetical protein
MKPWMWIVGALVLVLGCCGGIAGLGFWGAKQVVSDAKNAKPIAQAFVDGLPSAKELKALIANSTTNGIRTESSGSCVANAATTEKLAPTTELELGNFSSKNANGKSTTVAEYFRDYTLGKSKLRIVANVGKVGETWKVESVSVECDPKPKDKMPDILQ